MTSNPKLALHVFDIIREIKDPERPENLFQLNVIRHEDITVTEKDGFFHIKIEFTPTVPHCHLTTLIGLCIRVKVEREFDGKHKVCQHSIMSTDHPLTCVLFLDGYPGKGRQSLKLSRGKQANE